MNRTDHTNQTKNRLSVRLFPTTTAKSTFDLWSLAAGVSFVSWALITVITSIQ